MLIRIPYITLSFPRGHRDQTGAWGTRGHVALLEWTVFQARQDSKDRKVRIHIIRVVRGVGGADNEDRAEIRSHSTKGGLGWATFSPQKPFRGNTIPAETTFMWTIKDTSHLC